MKQLFGFVMMGLVVGFVGCATNVEKGDELAQQGKYEEAIKLYEQVKSDDEEYSKAQQGIANCNFQLGEIAFNGKNWTDAIALYEKANTPEARERISACDFELGEIEFHGKNWKKAIAFYEKANTPEAKERISSCNFQLGEIEFNSKNWQQAISFYSKSSGVGAAERIQSAKHELEKVYASDAKNAMAESKFDQAHSLWSKLDKDGKVYADNKRNIEETLVSLAGARLEASNFSSVISLLGSKKFSTNKYANQVDILLGHTDQTTTAKYVNMARSNVKSQHSKFSPGERLG